MGQGSQQSQSAGPEGPGIRIPPPSYPVVSVALGVLLNRVLAMPGPEPQFGRPVATVFLLAWAGLFFWSWHELRRFGTTIRPDRPATALVTTGPYAVTRNPLYLGLLLLQVAAGLWLSNLWILLFIPLTASLLTRFAIRKEERHLQALFGEAYRRYQDRVPRWL